MRKRTEIRFFRSDNGHEPARTFLKNLPTYERLMVASDIRLLQMTWPVGKPLVYRITHNHFELHSQLPGKTYRVLFYYFFGCLIFTTAFKTRPVTPPRRIHKGRRTDVTIYE
jgi:hypothetical protein